jgi:hypothetical protein
VVEPPPSCRTTRLRVASTGLRPPCPASYCHRLTNASRPRRGPTNYYSGPVFDGTDFLAPVKRALGLGDDAEGATYVCIRCGATFERDYRDCPECGKPYVALDE